MATQTAREFIQAAISRVAGVIDKQDTNTMDGNRDVALAATAAVAGALYAQATKPDSEEIDALVGAARFTFRKEMGALSLGHQAQEILTELTKQLAESRQQSRIAG